VSWSIDSRAEDSIPALPGSVEIGILFPELQELYRAWEENPILKDTIKNLEGLNKTLRSDLDLAEKERSLTEREKLLYEREKELYKSAYEKQREITESALKLAEISKPKTDWKAVPILGLVVIAIAAMLAL
jgi:hypothetical protein